METWVLILYLSIGFGTGSTGGVVMVDNISSMSKCEQIAKQFKNRLDSKYDWHLCEQVEK